MMKSGPNPQDGPTFLRSSGITPIKRPMKQFMRICPPRRRKRIRIGKGVSKNTFAVAVYVCILSNECKHIYICILSNECKHTYICILGNECKHVYISMSASLVMSANTFSCSVCLYP